MSPHGCWLGAQNAQQTAPHAALHYRYLLRIFIVAKWPTVAFHDTITTYRVTNIEFGRSSIYGASKKERNTGGGKETKKARKGPEEQLAAKRSAKQAAQFPSSGGITKVAAQLRNSHRNALENRY